MSDYILIQPSEDGDPIAWLDSEALAELLEDPLSYAGVERFLDRYPGNPNYWEEGTALLLKVEPVVPQPVVAKWRLP